jgi:hypothetical protein
MNIGRAAKRGFALPIALAVVVLLAAVAALASIASRAALRESMALSEETQAMQSRATLRARAERQLSRVPRGELLGSPRALGAGDTLMSVVAFAWPWHRVTVSAEGVPVVAEFARGLLPDVPWCSAGAYGGATSVAAGSLSGAPGYLCAPLLVAALPARIAAFDDSLRTELALPVAPDTLTVTSIAAGVVVLRSRRRIDVADGGSVSGILVAPIVCVANGGMVRGIVVARDSLIVQTGGALVGDSAIVRAAILAFSRLQPVGRAGLLLPP